MADPLTDAILRRYGLNSGTQMTAQGTGVQESIQPIGSPTPAPATPGSGVQESIQPIGTPTAPTPAAPPGMDQFGDYDPSYENALQQATNQQNMVESGYNTGVQRLNTNSQFPMQQLDQQHQDALTMLQNTLAQNGILRSSNNLEGQGRLNDAYQSQIGGLINQRQQGLEDLSTSRENYLMQIQQYLAQAQQAHAGVLATTAKARAKEQADQAAAAQAQAAQQQANDAAQIQLDHLMNPPTTATGQYVPAGDPNAPWNVGKPTGAAFDALPQWQQMGLGSQEQYNNLYGGDARVQDILDNLNRAGNQPGAAQNALSMMTGNEFYDPFLSDPRVEAVKRRLGL